MIDPDFFTQNKDKIEAQQIKLAKIFSTVFQFSQQFESAQIFQKFPVLYNIIHVYYDKFIKFGFINECHHTKNNALNFSTLLTQLAIELNYTSKSDVLNLFIQRIISCFNNQADMIKANQMFFYLSQHIRLYQPPDGKDHMLLIGNLSLREECLDQLYLHHLKLLINNFEIMKFSKNQRRLLYRGLSNIVFKKEKLTKNKQLIEKFYAPFKTLIGNIEINTAASQIEIQGQLEKLRITILNSLYDFHGTLMEIEEEYQYNGFFAMIKEIKYIEKLQQIIELCPSDYKLIIQILKFLCEMMLNRCNRLTFEPHSPYAFQLFQHLSKLTIVCGKIIIANGKELMKMNGLPQSDQIYLQLVKPAGLLLSNFYNLITSKMINLSILKQYKDPNLFALLTIIFELFEIIKIEDIAQFPKVAKFFYMGLKIVSQNYFDFYLTIQPQAFRKILYLICDGVVNYDITISQTSLEFLANTCRYYFNAKTDTNQDQFVELDKFLKENITVYLVFQEIVKILFLMLLNGEITKLDCISRALLGLIHFTDNYFVSLTQQLTNYYGNAKSATLIQCFTELMQDVPSVYDNYTSKEFHKSLKKFSENVFKTKNQ